MDNAQALEDFFRSFRITLTNAFSYSKDHPYFIKSVESFKSKLDEAFIIVNPLKIGVTNLGLMVDGENLSKAGLYEELSRLLHQRKIKSIEISSGVSIQELVQFLSVISLSQKEILQSGGVNAILAKNKPSHITVDELDYSVFLQGEGRECADIWGYMFKEAVRSDDALKLAKAADDFCPFIKRSNEKDIIEGEEIPASINEFLTCLRDKNKEKFDKCSKEVFLWLLRNKRSLDENKLGKLKPVFNSLNHEDFSALLWEGLTHEDDFDILSLELFSKISEQKNPPKIAEGFFNKISQSQYLKDNPNVVRKIQDLLSSTRGDQISAVYHNTLESLVKGVSPSGSLSFDQKKLRENYRYILLSMLSIDKDEDNLKLAAEILEKEFAGVFEDNAVSFLKDLYGLLLKRKKEGISVYISLEKKLSVFIEDIILNQTLSSEQEFLMEMVSLPGHELNFYLDKIFVYGKTNKQVLTLFFRLFPGDLDVFYERLGQKLQDMEFFSNLVEALSQLDIPVDLGILEHIYSSANELIKLDVLKAMRKLKKIDVFFLKQQLNTDSFLLKKSLCSVLILDAQGRDIVLNLLFKISNFCGRKNKQLMENMQIAFDLRFVDALESIQNLSRRKFFWNKELRNKARQILKEWNVL